MEPEEQETFTMAWRVTSPVHNFPLRLHCQHLTSMGGSNLIKCVLQKVAFGHPVAEAPLAAGWHDKQQIEAWIAKRTSEGWTFEPEIIVNKNRFDALRAKRTYQDLTKRRKCPRCKGDAEIGKCYCENCKNIQNAKRRERRRQDMLADKRRTL